MFYFKIIKTQKIQKHYYTSNLYKIIIILYFSIVGIKQRNISIHRCWLLIYLIFYFFTIITIISIINKIFEILNALVLFIRKQLKFKLSVIL